MVSRTAPAVRRLSSGQAADGGARGLRAGGGRPEELAQDADEPLRLLEVEHVRRALEHLEPRTGDVRRALRAVSGDVLRAPRHEVDQHVLAEVLR